MHANIYKKFTPKKKKHEHSLFTPLISTNDSDKPKNKIYNNPLQCEGWKTQKAPIVLQSANNSKIIINK